MPGAVEVTVWEDRNGDGVRDDDEPPLPGALVQAWEFEQLVASCITDENGQCVLSNLMPGTYTILMTPPTGYAPTTIDPITVTVSEGATIQAVFGAQRVQFNLWLPLVMRNARFGFWLYLPVIMKASG